MDKKRLFIWPVIAVVILTAAFVFGRTNRGDATFQRDEGFIFGTIYEITYQNEENLNNEILETLNKVNMSLSPFEKNSIISHINRNEKVATDSMFNYVFNMAMTVSRQTGGAFDITIAPLVNAWGFGFKQGTGVDSATIDSLRQFIGYKKVSLNGNSVEKADSRTMLDCSAIAKGYGCDAVAELLDSKGIGNYMINIGGEIVVKGMSPKNKEWKIGVNKPVEDSLSQNDEILTVLNLSNTAMATSGNYRNFYYRNGKKYAHTIDPRIGYPVQHSLLSATVIAKKCALADAYATSFMVMGLEEAKAFCQKHPEIEAYFIYSGEDGSYRTYFTPSLKKKIAD